jgi:filamentous hemagglutinin family protein
MTKKYKLNKSLQLGLAGLLGWLIVSVFTTKTQAQQSNIVPDNTLGAESSQVIGNFQKLPIEVITGGATRQINLFHSFKEFNISEGRAAYFFSPSGDIQNILARVTGTNPSGIFGKLGTVGNSSPNLFLINPNGIVFGKNASLDVQGSFVGTTANGVQFGNQGIFSATNPQAAPLLTINPSVLLFNQIQANGGIINQSQAPAGMNPIGEDVAGLRVADSKSLLLVGGNINIDSGSIRAYGGNIELAGLAAPGNVELNIAGDNLGLVIPENVERADVSLSNGAEINVRGAGGGNIKIQARNVNLAGQSILRAGIATGLGSPDSQGGDVTINATGQTKLIDSSFIANVVQARAFGKAGDINIKSSSFALSNDAFLNASLFGQGNGGNISIQTSDAVEISNRSSTSNNIESGAVGNGGDINITAGSLSLTDSSQIQSLLRDANDQLPGGQGNAGNVNINVQGDISFRIARPNEVNGINFEVGEGAIGNSGNVTINTSSLEMTDASQIRGITRGKGDSGNIVINARNNIALDGTVGNFSSGIINGVALTGEGNAGDIQITTGTLKATNGASISSVTLGKGNGGDIYLKTGSLSLINGSNITADVLGQGNAGNITVEATDNVKLDGFPSGLGSSLLTGGVGKAGNIQVTTGSLLVTNGASISNDTDGVGNAGNITINARDNVTFLGFDSKTKIPSRASSFAFTNAIGNGGEIRITAANLLLKDGGQLAPDISKQGNAGNIFLDIGNTMTLDGIINNGLPSLVTTTAYNGNGGNIQIATGSLFITNGARISSSHLEGKGNSGNISINARDSVIIDGVLEDVTTIFGKRDIHSGLFSSLDGGEGKGGDIKITTGSLAVTNGAIINGSTSGQGNGGNITINARDTVTFDSGENGSPIAIGTIANSNSTGNAGNIRINAKELFVRNDAYVGAFSQGQGNGGDIEITTGSLAVTNGAFISAGTQGQGNGGNITINASDTITLDGGENGLYTFVTTSTTSNSTGNAGNIRINAKELFVKNAAQFGAFSSSQGNAGNIFIEISDAITFERTNSNNSLTLTGASSFATASGNGGNIQVKTGTLTLRNGGSIVTIANRNAGNINIDTRDAVIIDGVSGNIKTGAFSSLFAGGVGKGGDIQITTNSLTLRNGGQLAGESLGKGNAGDITVKARDAISIDGVGENGSFSGAFTTLEGEAEGRGGNINLTTGSLFLTNGGTVNASTFARGDGGNITIHAGDRIFIDGFGRIGNTIFFSGVFSVVDRTSVGNAGNINLTTDSFSLSNSGRVSTSSLGQGKAGDINIDSGSTTLDTQAFIAAITNSGDGGNINLTANDRLILRGGSGISTTAGTAQSGGDGGNININSRFIVAIPKENSDITANAFTGTGGNVEIYSQGIFGIESRPKLTEKSDITASSEQGVAGVININVPDTSSIQNSFTELSPVIDTNSLIANSCISRGTKRQENSFTITGSGALTTNRPGVAVSTYTTGEVRGVGTTSRSWKKGDPIIEPQAMYRLDNGQLLLSRECSE